MPQDFRQIQEQKLTQEQEQRITAQHLLAVKLLEMPLARLEEDINSVLDDNQALEKEYESENIDIDNSSSDNSDDNDNELKSDSDENQERNDEIDKALDEMGRDDELSSFAGNNRSNDDDSQEIVYADSVSFYDQLKEQIGGTDLSETDLEILDYLIGSIDNDGLLHKDLSDICDELSIYNYIDTTTAHVEEILKVLQSFDPPGIGARNLQECLLIQIDRLQHNVLTELMKRIVNDYFDLFLKKHFDKIKALLKTNENAASEAIKALCKLNPKPGLALSESVYINTNSIRPDFIIDVDDDGNVSFTINKGDMPKLKVSDDYQEQLKIYNKKESKLTRGELEAVVYYKDKVEKASWYIEALRQRYNTMNLCMKAIIRWQKKYFVDGEESELRPMILKDIAEKTGLDISTVSRFNKDKYVDTPWGIKPLSFFFIDGYTTEDGEELATMKIKLELKDVIEKEDHKHPYSDEAITKILKEKGFPIARRTVQKYREQMGIAPSRLRKK